jgi:hypothetical protein
MGITNKKSLAIVQSNYIPWIGYFDLINYVDEFVLLDDVQFTKRDWRNRNIIKSSTGPRWLTIPVVSKGLYGQLLNQTKVMGSDWRKEHWKALVHSYSKAAYFDEVSEWLHPLYRDSQFESLSQINKLFLSEISNYLGVQTSLTSSSQYPLSSKPTERLVSICLAAGASTYVSGPAAKDYLEVSLFEEHNIEVEWFSYPTYSSYPQLWGEFQPKLSIVDLLFNVGPKSQAHLFNSWVRDK